MEPAGLFTTFKAVSSVAQGLSGRAKAMDQAARAESEAYLADTQALQRDTIARDDLTRFLSTVKAARAANGLSSLSPNARVLMDSAKSASDRDRIIAKSDDRQRSSNLRRAAGSYRLAGSLSLATGFVRGGIPIAQSRM